MRLSGLIVSGRGGDVRSFSDLGVEGLGLETCLMLKRVTFSTHMVACVDLSNPGGVG